MAELRIRVGAALDSSVGQIFKNVAAASESAQRKISSDEKAAMALHSQLLKAKWSQEKEILQAEITETAKVNDRIHQLRMARVKADIRASEEAAKAERSAAVREAENTARDVGRIQRRSSDGRFLPGARTAQSGGGRDMAYRMGYWASRNLSPVTPMLSFAHRTASDLVRGAGVDFNFGSMVQKHIGLQAGYQALSNQGYQEHGKGASAVRQDVGVLQSEGMKIAKDFGFDPEKVREASMAFVDLTGNLEGARAALPGLARLSNATGADLTDMSRAAASVQVQLDRAMGDDVQGKAKSLSNIMRIFAGQGKLGAVEIKDLAAQMAKIATITNKFGGSREEVFASVGVLAQESRKAGGSASASQAATSVSRFASMLTNKSTVNAFAGQGINVFADKGQTTLRKPEEIILEALSHTGGNAVKMGGLFKNVMANRAVEGFTNIYNTTKGTNQEKLAKVHDEWMELAKAAMTEREEIENNARVMQESAKKAQVFQNQLQEIAGAMANKLLPALEQMAPKALEVADSLGRLVSYLAENPFAILPALITAAFAKAGVEQALRVGIESIVRDLSGKSGPGIGGGAGVVGNLAAAFTIASLAVTTLEVGMMTINKVNEEKRKVEGESIASAINLDSEAKLIAKKVAEGKATPEDIKKAKEMEQHGKENLARLKAEPGWIDALTRTGVKIFTDSDAVRKEDKRRAQEASDLQLSVDKLHAVLSGTLNVEVVNQPNGPAPTVNPKGRTDSGDDAGP